MSGIPLSTSNVNRQSRGVNYSIRGDANEATMRDSPTFIPLIFHRISHLRGIYENPDEGNG